ncbi:MAG: hypothetical protein IJC70_01390, partial [Firmicutes bacterium]|nr:hypothetical protein [Bacillota bacterium]
MIVILKPNCDKEQLQNLIDWLREQNVDVHIS